MFVRYTALVALLLLAGVVAAPAYAQKDAEPKAAGVVHKTPEAAFEAAKAAGKKGDYKAFFAACSPDSVDELAAGMVFAGTLLRGIAGSPFDKEGKLKEQFKDLFTVMDKHGLTEEAVKKVKVEKPEGKDPKDIAKAMKPLIALVKDRSGFLGDVLPVFMKNKPGSEDDFKAIGDAKLSDVKIDGDTAKGTIKVKKGGEDKEEPIDFVKVGKGWFIKIDPKKK